MPSWNINLLLIVEYKAHCEARSVKAADGNVLLAIVTRGSSGGGGRGASPGDGCWVESPANDRQTEHAGRGGGVTKFKLLRRPAHFL